MSTKTKAVSLFPTPIYNTPYFPHHLPIDSQGLIRSIEMIALPGTLFTIQETDHPHVWQVTTEEYPSSTPLYVDNRLLQINPEAQERQKVLPSSKSILDFMQSLVGTRYFWGGNWAVGIPKLQQLYPNLTSSVNPSNLICEGVDCSGLLFQATDGFTPRNTSDLIKYGQEIPITDLSAEEVRKIVKPLDIIVWKGHVVIILNSDQIIESVVGKGGVVISDFIERYTEITQKLHEENKTFSLRRWHLDFLT